MNINRVTLRGRTGKETKSTVPLKGHRITRLALATTKRYQDAQRQWQEKTQWHTCVAYGLAADYAAQIPTGAHILIEGELMHREYERTVETDSGPVKAPWPITEVVITSLSLLYRPEKQS